MAFDVLSFVMGQQTAKSGGGSDIELIENMPFVVDFSEGDQFIEAPEGYAVKSAVVKKPENLVAENIAEGVNIAGITGTLASGGGTGGGSSLEPGIYYKHCGIPAPNEYKQVWFTFKGELYANTYPGYGNVWSDSIIYKYVNNAWTTFIPQFANNLHAEGYAFERNNILHYFRSNSHFTWDGSSTTTSFVEKNDLPYEAGLDNIVLYNNEFYFFYYNGNVYKWDEATDTWNVETTLTGKKNRYATVINNEIYVAEGAVLYKYVNKSLEKVIDLPFTPSGGYFKNNGKKIFMMTSNGKSRGKGCTYNPKNNTVSDVYDTLYFGQYNGLAYLNGKLAYRQNDYPTGSNVSNRGCSFSYVYEVE